MPNWCNNKLRVEDCSPELAAYLQAEGLSFEKIKPTPPEMMNDEKGSWYGWRIANWGTKWDIDEKEQREVADMLLSESADFTAAFDTAWSPPLQAIAALSEKFPDDKFILEYLEQGIGFCGTAQISKGVSVEYDLWESEEPAEFQKFATDVFGYEPEEIDE
jgi:hypothetical protein